MQQSITYYITLLVLKLKGIKKNFGEDPVDVKKIRKEDVHHPQGRFFRKNQKRTFQVLNSFITEIARNEAANRLLIFIHGGAFISGPAQHHWDTIKTIANQTNYTIWMCDYPKAPEAKISQMAANMDALYNAALETYEADQISVIGDSVGGTLVASLMQRLIKTNRKLPHKIILVSPVMDATLSNPEIERVDKIDPILSKKGILSAKKMCSENGDLKSTLMSPLNGCFEKFPPTILFLAENDIMYPDQRLAVKKFLEAKVDFEVIEGKNMPHIWPYLPVMKEAKVALNRITRILNKES